MFGPQAPCVLYLFSVHMAPIMRFMVIALGMVLLAAPVASHELVIYTVIVNDEGPQPADIPETALKVGDSVWFWMKDSTRLVDSIETGNTLGTEEVSRILMKIYTKKGDKGKTSLLYGTSVSKDNIAPEAYGSVDELVAALGLVRQEDELSEKTKVLLLNVQRELFIVGAELATSKSNREKLKPNETLVTESMVDELEKVIDELTEKNGIPEYFVVPGNNSISSKLDWCRVVSRRAERRCVTWQELNKLEDSFVITYLNRLSDLLWMMARDYEDEWTASK